MLSEYQNTDGNIVYFSKTLPKEILLMFFLIIFTIMRFEYFTNYYFTILYLLSLHIYLLCTYMFFQNRLVLWDSALCSDSRLFNFLTSIISSSIEFIIPHDHRSTDDNRHHGELITISKFVPTILFEFSTIPVSVGR